MRDEENDRQVKRIARLGTALGKAWGAYGLKGPPRFIMLVRDDRGKWRLASTEDHETTVTVLEGVVGIVEDEQPMTAVIAPYSDARKLQ